MSVNKNITIQGSANRPILIDTFIPQTEHPMPVVIFCHGYKGFKDWGGWNLMATAFYNAGIALVKFNFSHNGGTVEQPIDFPDLEAFAQNNYSIEMNDLELVLDWVAKSLSKSTRIDLSQICLLGHSRGGGIATLMAAQDKRIKKLITLAAVSDFRARFLEGSPYFAQWKKEGITYVENSRTKQQLPHYFQFYKDFIANQAQLTIKLWAEQLIQPHLIIHGTADPTIPVKEAAALHAWSPTSELFLIPQADHVFGMQHPWNKTELPEHMRQVVAKAIGFINK